MRFVLCSMSSVLLASAALAQPPQTAQPTTATATATPPGGPLVRVSDRPAADTRDSRVDMGGFRISMPGNPASGPAGSSVVRADGAILVPDNTLGEGLSLQQRNDLISAQIRQEEARAFFDERVAERALPDTRWGFIAPGTIRFGGFAPHDGGWYPRSRDWNDRRPAGRGPLVGPVTTTTTPSDQLGAKAQRTFADAATPRINSIEQGRADAVKGFGAAATPPVAQIENDRSQAFLTAQREAPTDKK